MGVDIVEILPTSTKQTKYYIVAIDYMTKWVEAHPLATITEEAAKKFMLEQVILRFGISKRLGEAKGLWAEELSWVLWAYRTTPRSSTGETPFRLTYGTDALLPIEVGLESHRTEVFGIESNKVGLRANIDLLEEEREAAHQRNLKF
ncbi:uncharacterized protein LOC141674494 [Apium graveolens]|uniref:uncharacterized protein LOC141674494 n=1 Tax=Apium graveolens TaxID=4045 RepID=UPI003D7A32E3